MSLSCWNSSDSTTETRSSMAAWASLAKGVRTALTSAAAARASSGVWAPSRRDHASAGHSSPMREASIWALALICPLASESWERLAARASPMPSTSQPRPAAIWFRPSVTCRWLATSSARPASSWACAASSCEAASADLASSWARPSASSAAPESSCACASSSWAAASPSCASASFSAESIWEPASSKMPWRRASSRSDLMASTRALTASTDAS